MPMRGEGGVGRGRGGEQNVLQHSIHFKICLIAVIFGLLVRQTLWVSKV